MRTTLVLFALVLAAPAAAQYRSESARARMEIAFDHGYGGGSEGGYAELAGDVRIWAPYGVGLIVRTGLASNVFSNAFAVDLGVGARVDLAHGSLGGLQLYGALGGSVAYGPFDGYIPAFGGFAMAGLDLWHRNFFVGIAASAHALYAEGHQDAGGRGDPIWTLAPMLRVGGDFGL